MDTDEPDVLQAYQARVRKINARERRMRAMSDDELRAVTDALKNRLLGRLPAEADALKRREPIPFRASRKNDARDTRE